MSISRLHEGEISEMAKLNVFLKAYTELNNN